MKYLKFGYSILRGIAGINMILVSYFVLSIYLEHHDESGIPHVGAFLFFSISFAIAAFECLRARGEDIANDTTAD